MNNKKDDPFGCGGMLVIFISIIATQIISVKLDLSSANTRELSPLIFGVIFTVWYLLTKVKK